MLYNEIIHVCSVSVVRNTQVHCIGSNVECLAAHEVTTGVETFKLPYKDYFIHICGLVSFNLDAKLFLRSQP